jgi:sec-independent protein translocase protein TatB
MFDIGFWELVILFGLGLMVLGPERMPKVAAQLGRWAGQARGMARNLTRQMRDELEPLETMKSNLDKTMRTDFSAQRPEPGQQTETENPGATATEPSGEASKPESDKDL